MMHLDRRDALAGALALAVLVVLLWTGARIQDVLLIGLIVAFYVLQASRIGAVVERLQAQAGRLRDVRSDLAELADRDVPPVPAAGSTASPDAGPGTEQDASDGDAPELVSRELQLGTVAIVEGAMTPEEVSKVLAAQKRRPQKQFGELAIEAGHLRAEQLEQLLEVQEKGVYDRGKLAKARSEIRRYVDGEDG